MADSNILSRAFVIGVGATTLCLAALLLALPTSTSGSTATFNAEQRTVAIIGTRVFDGRQWLDNTDVLIEDGLIAALGQDVTLPESVHRIDGANLTVLPGLVDAHTHSFGPALSDALRFGVTTTLDMFTAAGMLPTTREARATLAPTREADLYSSGTLATVEGGHGTQYGMPVETLGADVDPVAWVTRRKAEGSDYIKLVYMPHQTRLPSLDLATAQALIDAAHDQNLLALAHISTARAAQELLDAGIDGLVHIFADVPASDGFIAQARAANLFVIPTLAVLATADQQGEGAKLAEDPHLSPHLGIAQVSSLNSDFGLKIPTMTLASGMDNVRRLHAGGVTIMAGSDAPNPGTTHGASLHHELDLLVRSGLSNTQALSAATATIAANFSLGGRGTLAVGGRADLVVVEGNPDQNIKATRNIVHIFKNGAEVARGRDDVTAAPMVLGSLSEFRQGIAAPEGYAWSATDDSDMQGQSKATISHVAPTLANDSGAVRVVASVKPGFSFPWAGVYFGPSNNAPRDLGGAQRLALRMRGTPAAYRIMLFNAGSAGAPPTHQISVTEQWQTFTVELDALTTLNRKSVAGIAIVAGPQAGDFRFDLTDVVLE